MRYTDGTTQDIRSNGITHANKTVSTIKFTYGYYDHVAYLKLDQMMIHEWEGENLGYEPFRNYVNDDPVFIDTTSSTALTDVGEVD